MADINNYRSRILIYKRVYTPTDLGGFTETLTLIDTVWAKITPMQGKELLNYRQVYPTAQDKINIRYRPDMNPDFKILYGSTYHNILSVIDINNLHDELEIITEVKQSEQ